MTLPQNSMVCSSERTSCCFSSTRGGTFLSLSIKSRAARLLLRTSPRLRPMTSSQLRFLRKAARACSGDCSPAPPPGVLVGQVLQQIHLSFITHNLLPRLGPKASELSKCRTL